jgi:signal transduction histidine kinase
MNRRTFILLPFAALLPAPVAPSRFSSLSEEIQNYIKMRTPEWERLYPDRQQIRSQLYRNALKYARPSGEIRLRSTVMEKVTPFSQLSDEIKKFMDKVHEERDRMSRITPLSDEAIRYVSMPPKEPSAS